MRWGGVGGAAAEEVMVEGEIETALYWFVSLGASKEM